VTQRCKRRGDIVVTHDHEARGDDANGLEDVPLAAVRVEDAFTGKMRLLDTRRVEVERDVRNLLFVEQSPDALADAPVAADDHVVVQEGCIGRQPQPHVVGRGGT